MSMKNRELAWWLYILIGVMVGFVVPMLMSARDDTAVVLGIAVMVVYAVVSWKFWIKPLYLKMVTGEDE